MKWPATAMQLGVVIIAALSGCTETRSAGITAPGSDITSRVVKCDPSWHCLEEMAAQLRAPLLRPKAGTPTLEAMVTERATTGSVCVTYMYRSTKGKEVAVIGIQGPEWARIFSRPAGKDATITAARIQGQPAKLISYPTGNYVLWQANGWTWRIGSTSTGETVLNEAAMLRTVAV